MPKKNTKEQELFEALQDLWDAFGNLVDEVEDEFDGEAGATLDTPETKALRRRLLLLGIKNIDDADELLKED